MDLLDEADVRRAFERYIARKGHGAIVNLANKAGISRMTVSRFRTGGTVDESTLLKLAKALAGEGFDPANRSIPAETAPEHEGPDESSDPLLLLAERLDVVASHIRNPYFTREARWEEFASAIKALHDGLNSYSIALDEFNKKGK